MLPYLSFFFFLFFLHLFHSAYTRIRSSMGILMTVVCNAVEIIYGPLWVSDSYNENWSFDSLDMWGLSIYFFFIYFIFLTHFRWFPSFARLHRLLAQVPPMVFFFSFLPRKVTGSFPPHFSLFFKGIFFFFSVFLIRIIFYLSYLGDGQKAAAGMRRRACSMVDWLPGGTVLSLSHSIRLSHRFSSHSRPCERRYSIRRTNNKRSAGVFSVWGE